MGVINHNVVIASTIFDVKINHIKQWIKTLDEEDKKLFLISEQQINGYITIFCGPDGSKEGWPESANGDEIRNKFIAKLNEYWNWIEVSYGEFGQKIIKGNNKERL